ncbi:MAG: hypothetical protein IT195_01700, partial [Microthrixaceae bacterium]|nr:hypothetical protein [Microthrixaceae bacterium]
MTLIEVMVTVSVISIILTGLAAWSVATMGAQALARRLDREAATMSLINATLLRDATSAQFSAASVHPGDLVDCIGGEGAATTAEDVRLALVTPGDRRVVYTLVDSTSGGPGKELWRRDCANTRDDSPDPTNSLGAVGSFTDPTLTDPVVGYLNAPTNDDLTAGTRAERVADGLTAIDSSCPAYQGAASQDVNCQIVRVTATLVGSNATRVAFQGTRRTDTYCAPGCAPVARFTFTPPDPSKDSPVSFDATASFDRRDDYCPNPNGTPAPCGASDPSNNDPATRLIYEWNFDGVYVNPTTGNYADGPRCDATPPGGTHLGTGFQAQHTYDQANGIACPAYYVTLRVTNASGSMGLSTRLVVIEGKRPTAVITNPPIPIRVVRNQPVQFTSLIQTWEDTIDPTLSQWDFGDAEGTIIQLRAAASSPGITCTTPTPCTTLDHSPLYPGYSTNGVKLVRLTVTDSLGLTSSFTATVIVEPEYYYASETWGNDSAAGGCGPIAPVFKPCKTITQALANAAV